MEYLLKHMPMIIKVQARFRGFLARRQTAFIMNSRRVSIIILIRYLRKYRLTPDTSQSMKAEKLFLSLDNMILMPKEKKEILINSKLEPPTTVNGSEALETDTEFKSGQMVLNMKDSGKTIELTEKENSSILTAIFMTEIG